MKRSYQRIPRDRLGQLLASLNSIRVAVIGDGSLDVYWEADMTRSELSRETPHFPLPVVTERFSLGGGANVTANLTALGVHRVDFVTVIGQDWRGNEFKRLMSQKGIKLDGLIEDRRRFTPAYCKPIRKGISEVVYEDPRIDFENTQTIDAVLEEKVLAHLEEIITKTDALIVTDQLVNGVITEKVRNALSTIGSKVLIAVDSRRNIGKFRNVIVKPNEVEALQAIGHNVKTEKSPEWTVVGQRLSGLTGAPVVLTLGACGALWVGAHGDTVRVPTIPAEGPIDIVGAGDCFMAAFAATLAADAQPEEAIEVGNLAAAVAVKKLGITGSATQNEILNKYDELYGR